MEAYILNIARSGKAGVSLACKDKKTGERCLVTVPQMAGEIAALPRSQNKAIEKDLENEVLERVNSDLVLVDGCKMAWREKVSCFEQDPARIGEARRYLVFYTSYERSLGAFPLNYCKTIHKSFSNPVEAFILLKKIRGIALVSIDRYKEVSPGIFEAELEQIRPLECSRPPLRTAFIYAHKRSSFEEISLVIRTVGVPDVAKRPAEPENSENHGPEKINTSEPSGSNAETSVKRAKREHTKFEHAHKSFHGDNSADIDPVKQTEQPKTSQSPPTEPNYPSSILFSKDRNEEHYTYTTRKTENEGDIEEYLKKHVYIVSSPETAAKHLLDRLERSQVDAIVSYNLDMKGGLVDGLKDGLRGGLKDGLRGGLVDGLKGDPAANSATTSVSTASTAPSAPSNLSFPTSLKHILFCDLPRFVESVKKLNEYSLAEIFKGYRLSTPLLGLDAPSCILDECEKSSHHLHEKRSFISHVNLLRFSVYQISCVFEKGLLLELAESLARTSGCTLNTIFNGFKSERVEHLLLHEMRTQGYLIPKKKYADEKGENESDKSTYEGGLVFLDKPGEYLQNYVALFDFNSLYPSIIREYNVCFSTAASLSATDPPKRQALLPGVVEALIEQRSKIKRKMKTAKNEDMEALNVEQNAVKLVANCIYGCLGFKGFRFYNKTLASFITERGRNILKDTKAVLEGEGYGVIYGDTDSVMVDTGISTNSGEPSAEMLLDISKKISSRYTHIVLGFEKTFRKLVMLAKKKYFGVFSTGAGKEHVEEKGLETSRRDWSEVGRDAASKVIRALLYSETPEEEILGQMSAVRENIKLPNREKFVMRRRIAKNPEEYGETQALSLPQVALALRLKKEQQIDVQGGDILSFVMALAHGRSRPETVYEKGEIDTEYYVKMQILSPVLRMVEHFPAISAQKIKTALGVKLSRSEENEGSAFGTEGAAAGGGDPRHFSHAKAAEKPKLEIPTLHIAPPCCKVEQEISFACLACGKAHSNEFLEDALRFCLGRSVCDLYSLKRRCGACDAECQYMPVCLKCAGPTEWRSDRSGDFYETLCRLEEIFSRSKEHLGVIRAFQNHSAYSKIDLASTPLNVFNRATHLPSIAGRISELDAFLL